MEDHGSEQEIHHFESPYFPSNAWCCHPSQIAHGGSKKIAMADI